MSNIRRGLLCFFAGLFVQVCLAYGAKPGRDPAHEKVITDSLQQSHPEMVDMFRAATEAYDKPDYALAAQLYGKVVEVAPTFDAALRRLGGSLVNSGKRAEGLSYCEEAVSVNRSSANLFTLAMNVITPRNGAKASDPADLREALKLLTEARSLPGGVEIDNFALSAEVAYELAADREFRTAVSQLCTQFPDTMQAHYFSAIAEALDEHWIRAQREILAAQEKGLAPEAAQRFLDLGIHSRALNWEIGLGCAALVGAWLLGLGLLFGIGFVLSKLTLRSAQNSDPNVTLSSTEQKLRKIYRALLNIAGVYYYISLPIVLLIVLGTCAGILFLILAAGFIAIKLMLILVIGAVITVVAMIKSLFLKTTSEESGRALTREEAPGLWELTEEVARDIGTRPIDEIRITPGTDLAVYERGKWRQKMSNDAKRILLLGTGVLNGFKQDGFRSVLAHEYGHFSHRDTAGGEVALRVRNDMIKFYLAMYQAGQARSANLAFQFLRVYHFIFRRISHGATRLQEILADRVAAQTYGASAFESGLKHVIRRSIEFGQIANLEIDTVIKSQQPLRHIYESTPSDMDSIEKEVAEAMTRATTDDDTHPSPSDRFKLVAAVQTKSKESKDGLVWDLFIAREEITKEMLTRLEAQIAPHRPKAVSS